MEDAGTDTAMKFSVIIPAYNEEKFLPRLLQSIEAARANYSGGRDQVEVIVADNDSTDRTAEVSQAHGARVVRVAKRRIAAARNGGARAANGDVLCFIDADSAVHPQTFDAIDTAMKTGRYVWGVTGAKLERTSFALGVTYCLMMPMVWVTGLDTGLSFAAARISRPSAVMTRRGSMRKTYFSHSPYAGSGAAAVKRPSV